MKDISEYKILIIQNTSYHFETTISLYSSLKRLNPKKLDIIQIALDPDIRRVGVRWSLDQSWNNQQKEFLTNNSISHINVSDVSQFSYDMVFVVSAYPNPFAYIPSIENELFKFYENKIIYICHRFNNNSDYTTNPRINFKNSLALSKLSKNIGLDFFYPIEYEIKPKLFTDTKPIFCIQGRFGLNNRIILSNNIFSCSNDFTINFIGTNIPPILKCKNHKLYSNLNEINFYNILNECKFLLPMIDDKIKDSTYSNQRFSSNFNHAMALEKPIFAHEFFKDIYEIPGIYYNEANIENKFDELLKLNNDEYFKMINQFNEVKNKYYEHNNKILSQKIFSLIN
jgi:hypothetical protein